MILNEFLPCPRLRAYISSYHTINTLECGMTHFAPVLPDGMFKIYWHFKDPSIKIYKDMEGNTLDWEDGIVGYCPEGGYQFSYPKNYRLIAAIVKPSFFHKICKISIDEINNRIFTFSELQFSGAEEIREPLRQTKSEQEISTILDRFFLKKCTMLDFENDPIAFAEEAIIHNHGDINVSHLADAVCLHPRTLERRFLREIGTSPKVYARISRFKHLFELKCDSRNSWYDIIDKCKYHDQTHLIKDFKKITGQCPDVFFNNLFDFFSSTTEIAADQFTQKKVSAKNAISDTLFSYTYQNHKYG